MDTMQLIESIKRSITLADMGLLYATTEYDRDRYTELKEISLNQLHQITLLPPEAIHNFYLPVKEYPTVKVDVRGFVLNQKKQILFVKEQSDGLWALPGGWADIGHSPSEAVVKEVREEAGLLVKPLRLLAVFDNKCHPHPPQAFYIYKIILLCSLEGGTLKKGFDMLDANFFDLADLPPLSVNRIVKSQVDLLYERSLSGNTDALFD